MSIRFPLLAVLALAAASSASAQSLSFLDMAVQPTPQLAAPGDTLSWNVLLTNNNAESAFFVLVGFNDGLGVVPDITIPAYDFSSFGLPMTLAPGGSVLVSDLFRTLVGAGASAATYTSIAEIDYDLYEDGSFLNVSAGGVAASGDWQLLVQPDASTAPEPGTLALFVSAAAGALVGRFARRRK